MSFVLEKNTQTFAANQAARIEIAGNYFKVVSAIAAVTVTLLKGRSVIGKATNFLAGDYVKDVEFDGVIIENGSSPQDVNYILAGGGAGSDRVLLTGNGSFATQTQKTVGVGAVTLSNVNANRRFLLIQNTDTSETLRVTLMSGAAISATSGLRIPPNGSLLLDQFVPLGAIQGFYETAPTIVNNNVEVVEG